MQKKKAKAKSLEVYGQAFRTQQFGMLILLFLTLKWTESAVGFLSSHNSLVIKFSFLSALFLIFCFAELFPLVLHCIFPMHFALQSKSLVSWRTWPWRCLQSRPYSDMKVRAKLCATYLQAKHSEGRSWGWFAFLLSPSWRNTSHWEDVFISKINRTK